MDQSRSSATRYASVFRYHASAYLHLKRLHARRHLASDATEADDGERFAAQLCAHECLTLPFTLHHRHVRLWAATRQCHEHITGELRRRDAVALWSTVRRDNCAFVSKEIIALHNHSAIFARRIHVDIVDAGTSATDNLQDASTFPQHARCYFRRRTYNERFILVRLCYCFLKHSILTSHLNLLYKHLLF